MFFPSLSSEGIFPASFFGFPLRYCSWGKPSFIKLKNGLPGKVNSVPGLGRKSLRLSLHRYYPTYRQPACSDYLYLHRIFPSAQSTGLLVVCLAFLHKISIILLAVCRPINNLCHKYYCEILFTYRAHHHNNHLQSVHRPSHDLYNILINIYIRQNFKIINYFPQSLNIYLYSFKVYHTMISCTSNFRQ